MGWGGVSGWESIINQLKLPKISEKKVSWIEEIIILYTLNPKSDLLNSSSLWNTTSNQLGKNDDHSTEVKAD